MCLLLLQRLEPVQGLEQVMLPELVLAQDWLPVQERVWEQQRRVHDARPWVCRPSRSLPPRSIHRR